MRLACVLYLPFFSFQNHIQPRFYAKRITNISPYFTLRIVSRPLFFNIFSNLFEKTICPAKSGSGTSWLSLEYCFSPLNKLLLICSNNDLLFRQKTQQNIDLLYHINGKCSRKFGLKAEFNFKFLFEYLSHLDE